MSEIRQLSLRENLERHGARFDERYGWELPSHFGDFEGEYEAAISSAVLIDTSCLTIVRASGKDHLDYLHRRTSQDLKNLWNHGSRRACQLAGDGRMEADVEVFRIDEDSWIVAPPLQTGEDLAWKFNRFVFSEDAEFTDETGDWAVFCLIGPKTPEILGVDPEEFEGNTRITPVELDDGKTGYIFRCTYFMNAWLMAVPAEDARSVFERLGADVSEAGGRQAGWDVVHTLRVEDAVAWYGLDLTERSIPLEAGLVSALNYDKGCYPGQETIARITNLGHPASLMRGIVFDGTTAPVTPMALLNAKGEETGMLTSAAAPPNLGKALGLAMMKWKFREPGTKVETQSKLKGTVVELPFARED